MPTCSVDQPRTQMVGRGVPCREAPLPRTEPVIIMVPALTGTAGKLVIRRGKGSGG